MWTKVEIAAQLVDITTGVPTATLWADHEISLVSIFGRFSRPERGRHAPEGSSQRACTIAVMRKYYVHVEGRNFADARHKVSREVRPAGGKIIDVERA